MLNQPFKLPCGAVLPNRISKAAMTERLAGRDNFANDHHNALYEKWSDGGTGLLISGNFMVDRRYKESAGNIVIEDERGLLPLKKLAESGTKNDNHFWVQISHAGRQSTIFSTLNPLAPSAVKLKKLGLFAKPKAMTTGDIEDVIQRFVRTAVICQKAGFTGIQFHSAHGYLLSQFLSPKTNLRTDQYGGSIENRGRVLFSILQQSRKKLGADFPISVKLNSADFQRGGFNEEDALFVVKRLEELGVDLLEISGGTYENIVFFTKRSERESTRQREAYFLDFAQKVRTHSSIPLMVTGGFRSFAFCNQVLKNGELDIIGFARPYLLDETFPGCLLNGEKERMEDAGFDFKLKKMADMAEGAFFDYQIHRIAKGKTLKPNYNPYIGVLRLVKNEMLKGWF